MLNDDQIINIRTVAMRIVEQAQSVITLSGMEGTTGVDWYRQYHKERLEAALHVIAADCGCKLVPLTAEEIEAIRQKEAA